MSLFRFAWKGLHLRGTADSCPADKSPCAQNIRSYSGTTLRVRPGYSTNFSTGANAITDLETYATLQTDNKPRTLAFNSNGGVWLDNGVSVGNLAGPQGLGANMIPFRPSASPQAWMYIYGNNDAQKFQAPDSGNNVTAYQIGIKEPQDEAEFGPLGIAWRDFQNAAANWTNVGTAGSPADGTRTNDTVVTFLADPIIATRYSVQPGQTNNSTYSPGQVLQFKDANANVVAVTPIMDVLPATPTGNAVTISQILYDSGNTGFCTVVPSQIPVPDAVQMGYLARGSLLQFSGGGNNETVLVLSANSGPSGLVSIRTSTNNTWSAGNSVNGLPALIVDANATLANSTAIVSTSITSNLTTGIGAITRLTGGNPFNAVFNRGNTTLIPQQDDYLHISLWCNNTPAINEIKWLFNVGTNNNNFNENAFYFSVRPSSLTPVVANNSTQQTAVQTGANQAAVNAQITALTAQIRQLQLLQRTTSRLDTETTQYLQSQINQLQAQQVQLANLISGSLQTDAGVNQWSEILFPVSALNRIGTDESRTLFNTSQIQVMFNVSANCNFAISSVWVGGGGQPDIGDSGALYQYRIVPRSSTTGATGNPSPVPVYGINPRRQPVQVNPPSIAYDSQIDLFDVYRYGGTVAEWRYIGTGTAGHNFVDNYFDDTAQAGNALITDNFQPWPSVDVPFKVVKDAGNNSILMNGTLVVVTMNNTSFPATITRWLPGTEVQIDQLTAFPLWARPVLGNNNNQYIFKFGTPVGAGNANTLIVQEPDLAAQPNQYAWGPDAAGAFFAVGDLFRPGTLSYSKFNSPDMVSDKANIDICPPSEPLLGGQVIAGLSYVASFDRWWAMYPSFNNSTAYTPTEMPVGRGLAAPRGVATDGQALYWWAKDCIAKSGGGGYEDLTNADLYPLFPHEGEGGVNVVRNGITFWAPDYSRAGAFRMEVAGKFLFAHYQDSTGTPRTLVCDLEKVAWSQESYADPITVHRAIKQPEGGLLTTGNAYPLILLADKNGKVWTETDLHNDNTTPISCNLATYEWDGGSERSAARWYDLYLDCLASNNITATPQFNSGTAPGCAATTIATNGNRQLAQVPVGDGVSQRFLGGFFSWTDNFTVQTNPTVLYQWGAFVAPDGVNAWRTPFFVPHGMNGYLHVPRIEFAYIAANNVSVSITPFGGPAPANSVTLPATGNQYSKFLATFQPSKGLLYQIAATSNGNFQIILPDTVVSIGQWGRSGPYTPYRLPLSS